MTKPRFRAVVRISKIVSMLIHAPTEKAPSIARAVASAAKLSRNGKIAVAAPYPISATASITRGDNTRTSAPIGTANTAMPTEKKNASPPIVCSSIPRSLFRYTATIAITMP